MSVGPDPASMRPVTKKTAVDRFHGKIFYDTVTGCWLFSGSWSRDGYGTFWDGKRSGRAHRWAYENYVGPIPDGLQLDHLCRMRCCVNPDHLEPVTSRENVLRGEGRKGGKRRERCKSGRHLMAESRVGDGKRARCRPCDQQRRAGYRAAQRAVDVPNRAETCRRGHPRTPENTKIRKSNGWRECRECSRVANRAANVRYRARHAGVSS